MMASEVKISKVSFKNALVMGGDIVREHYDEVPFASGNLPFELDIDTYLTMEDSGYLMVFVATSSKKVVGYMVVVAFPMTHHKGHYGAQTDSFYVRSEWRKQGVLVALLERAVSECKQAGISSFQFVTNENFKEAEAVAESVGATPLEKTFVIELGD